MTFLLADLYLRKQYTCLAVHLLSNLLQNNPKHSEAWCNLGIAFREEGDLERAKDCWMKSMAISGETVECCSNLAGLYADRARPKEAIEWIDKAIKLSKGDVEPLWLKALCCLSLKQWDEGWKLYESRFRLPNWDSRKTVIAPLWDGKPVDHLYLHGEQGIGDEVMFLSAIPLMKHLAKKITLEVHAKVAGLAKQTWPEFEVVTVEAPGNYDAKLPIGSLCGMFGFNDKPYLFPNEERVRFYRGELDKLGVSPHLALTWIGGTKATRVEDRSLDIKELKPLMEGFTCVSAQYSDSNPYIDGERERGGLPKINDASTGLDLHEQAALFKAVDAVVTVQQTAVHVAGAVGAKCLAMIGSHPHWRYGVEGETLPWYSTVKLYRNIDGWQDVINRVTKDLRANY